MRRRWSVTNRRRTESNRFTVSCDDGGGATRKLKWSPWPSDLSGSSCTYSTHSTSKSEINSKNKHTGTVGTKPLLVTSLDRVSIILRREDQTAANNAPIVGDKASQYHPDRHALSSKPPGGGYKQVAHSSRRIIPPPRRQRQTSVD